MSKHKRVKRICEKAGVVYIGFQRFKGENLIYFNDPATDSTLTVLGAANFSVQGIKGKVKESRRRYEKNR
jgi:hypothetical protein